MSTSNVANPSTLPKTSKKHIIHSIIGLMIMILFRSLPLDLYGVTPVGMELIGIFIGTLYMWTTADILWGSLLSAFMIAISSYAPMNAVLNAYLGNPVFAQLFFLMIIIGCLVENKITLYIGRFFLTRKMSNGRPWIFSIVILTGVLLMSAFIIAFAPIFLMWPVLYGIFDEVGFKKGDAYPKIMLTLVVVVAIIGFPIPPFMNNGLALLSNYRNMASDPTLVNDAGYLATGLILGFIMMLACIGFSKFVLKPDISPLKNFNVEMLDKNPLPPMSVSQKITGITFVVLIVSMLVPSIFPTLPGMAFLKENSTGLALGATAILVGIRIHDQPVLNITKVMGSLNWNTLFLCATAILLGSVLTHESTGIVEFLNHTLTPLFGNMSPASFTILILLTAVVLTNLCNSLVIGMILQPVIHTYCSSTGTNASPIVSIMIIFVLGSAAITPAASPFAAILHGNKEWLSQKEVYKYTVSYVIIETIIVILIGIPLANLLT